MAVDRYGMPATNVAVERWSCEGCDGVLWIHCNGADPKICPFCLNKNMVGRVEITGRGDTLVEV